MTTKTVQKLPLEKSEIESIAKLAINTLSTYLRRGDFYVTTDGYSTKVEVTDVKAFISRQQIIIMLDFIDIHHDDLKTLVKIFDYEKDDYISIKMDHLSQELDMLLELAKEKVKEKLEKAIKDL